MTIAFAAFGVSIDQISARLIVDRIAIIALAGSEEGRKFLAAGIAARNINLISGAAGHRQSIDHVSRHKRIALVVFPPTPPAIVMLIGVKPIHTLLNFLVEIVRGANLRGGHVLQSLGDDDVRQEARHRLFGAAVREAG